MYRKNNLSLHKDDDNNLKYYSRHTDRLGRITDNNVTEVCRHFVPRYCSLGSDTSSHRAGGVTAVVEPIDARVAQCKNNHNLSA